jgi:predicted DNA-binding transcriptional regulator YafY
MAEIRTDAGSRLERLLAVLSWLAQHGQVSLADLADQFAMTSDQLAADLELAACCGLPPYTPDRLMEIIVGEDHVEALLGTELGRPRRLSAQEGFALAAAARASVAARGEPTRDADLPPLERALAKLEAALGDRAVLGVDLGDPAHLATVREAVAAGDQLEIDYVSAWRDARSKRIVDPVRLAAFGGYWYLDAWCHTAGGTRRFRVDRVVEVRKTGAEATRRADGDSAQGPFVPGEEATLVRLLVPPEAAWLVEAVPVLETSTRKNGSIEVTLGVVSTVWLERMLLQLGPTTKVLEPADLEDLGRDAAARVLARYSN